jgi:hypothetical protein
MHFGMHFGTHCGAGPRRVTPPPVAAPVVAAVEMGYGHLRAATAVAEALGTAVARVDDDPWALPAERWLWRLSRHAYELVSRHAARGSSTSTFAAALDWLTQIPEVPASARADLFVHAIGRMVDRGLGRELVERLADPDRPLVTTFFTPAIAAAQHGHRATFCVVTDTEVSRAWVAREPGRHPIHYLLPGRRGVARLRGYGVPSAHLEQTGFPLPPSLLSEDLGAARHNLARRLVNLDPTGRFRRQQPETEQRLGDLGASPQPLHLAFAVGGAGAQAALVDELLPALRPRLLAGSLRLTLIAGIRPEIAARFRRALARHQLPEVAPAAGASLAPPQGGVAILAASDLGGYFAAFARLLEDTDLLWSKPSELAFFAALGLPLVLTEPLGVHESFNRRALLEVGAALAAPRLPELARRLDHGLATGELAAAAWAGFTHLPRRGVYRIRDRVLATGASATMR